MVGQGIALVIFGSNPSASTFDHVAWIFAAYFAVAWLLLLGVIIRPEHKTLVGALELPGGQRLAQGPAADPIGHGDAVAVLVG